MRRASIDIVAVPGLGSHALGSWKSLDSGDVWLLDYLPENLPYVRLIVYGYDATLQDSTSKQSIEHTGVDLLERIAAFRAHDGTGCRPIVFIGHSLGGLLIKEALVHVAKSDRGSEKLDLSRSCYGMLFFGVPNHASPPDCIPATRS
ncbi:hypothetical protein NKR23_g12170 [Pleurostoma richardsiae]|uniref:AB hydrolase-1 domain-containing protein n=1 Tax=Pleurostoma richardsiae TaxID=41990 RepID=A0AA38VFV8_9PEZI|nr:hypothetical protein NKR23_g12170 [Pleurostoma richardsiae]